MGGPLRNKLWFLIALHGVLFLDILTKRAIMGALPLHHSQTVIPGFFNLVHIRNRGVAFGLLSSVESLWRDLLLVVLPLAAMGFILWILVRQTGLSGGLSWSLGAILGGAAGNLLDRLRYGGVVDFLDFYRGGFHWPAFNLADVAISLGVGFLIWRFWRDG